MEKSESSASSIRPMWAWKIVLKNLRNLAPASSLLACLALSATIWGQTADTNQPGPAPDPAASTASLAQPGQAGNGPHADDTYVIGDDDILAVNVWKEQELTRVVTVRSDGRISLPLAGEIQAAGRTPPQLEQEITDRLRGFITDPQVTVIVQEIKSQKFNILGQVGRPGSYPLTAGMTIVDAIAVAGGLKDFAKKKGVYLLRQNSAGAEERINFNYDKFIKVKNTAQNIKLLPNDTIVVP